MVDTERDTPFVALGYITKAHGVRGEISLHAYTDSLDLFTGPLWIEKDGVQGSLRQVKPLSARRHHGSILLTLEGVKDRNRAEELKGHTVLIPREKLPELDEEEVYLADILGLRVYLWEGENNSPTELGVVTEVAFPAGQELWSICTSAGQEVLLPAVPEFVLNIDLDAGTVLVDPPPGLLELFEDA